MPSIEQLVIWFFSPESIWSVVLRGVIWFVIAIVIIVSTDNPNPDRAFKNMKSNIGFFLMFLTLSGGLVYLLFGFTGV